MGKEEGQLTNIKAINRYHSLKLKILSSADKLGGRELANWNRTRASLQFLSETEESQDADRRKWSRFVLEEVSNLRSLGENGKIVYGITRNISLGGLFIESDTPLAVGELVKIQIFDESTNEGLFFWGRVQWIRLPNADSTGESKDEPVGMGIKFLTSPDEELPDDFLHNSD